MIARVRVGKQAHVVQLTAADPELSADSEHVMQITPEPKFGVTPSTSL